MKVLALAYNYKDLNVETGFEGTPLVFVKANNSITYADKINISRYYNEEPNLPIWVEVELGFVISEDCTDVAEDDATHYISHYVIGNDMTRKNIHTRDHHLALSKSLDGFCPILDLDITKLDKTDLRLTTKINGKITQDGNIENRVFDDKAALSYISKYFSLDKGDIILTGTPAGAMDSIVKPGDTAVLEIEGLGKLINYFE